MSGDEGFVVVNRRFGGRATEAVRSAMFHAKPASWARVSARKPARSPGAPPPSAVPRGANRPGPPATASMAIVADPPGASAAVRQESSRGLTGAHDPPAVRPDANRISGNRDGRALGDAEADAARAGRRAESPDRRGHVPERHRRRGRRAGPRDAPPRSRRPAPAPGGRTRRQRSGPGPLPAGRSGPGWRDAPAHSDEKRGASPVGSRRCGDASEARLTTAVQRGHADRRQGVVRTRRSGRR